MPTSGIELGIKKYKNKNEARLLLKHMSCGGALRPNLPFLVLFWSRKKEE